MKKTLRGRRFLKSVAQYPLSPLMPRSVQTEIPDFTDKWLESSVERTAWWLTQCSSNLVSSRSLRKMGVFAVMAGDFRQSATEERRIGSPETKPSTQKAPISGLISRFLASLAGRRSSWLGREPDRPLSRRS